MRTKLEPQPPTPIPDVQSLHESADRTTYPSPADARALKAEHTSCVLCR
jgi:hypothetical protein